MDNTITLKDLKNKLIGLNNDFILINGRLNGQIYNRLIFKNNNKFYNIYFKLKKKDKVNKWNSLVALDTINTIVEYKQSEIQ